MNVKLSSQHTVLAGFWWGNALNFNSYTVHVDMLTATGDVVEQNIAFLRLRYILENTLSDVVFVNQEETDVIDKCLDTGIRVAVLPEDPVDQIVGMALHAKLSAVVEDRLIIRAVRVSSSRGDNIVYEHSDAEFNLLFDQPGWWSTVDPVDTENTGTVDKASVIASRRRWQELELSWPSDTDSVAKENVVVFGEFQRNED